jgi:hypothetical protein
MMGKWEIPLNFVDIGEDGTTLFLLNIEYGTSLERLLIDPEKLGTLVIEVKAIRLLG